MEETDSIDGDTTGTGQVVPPGASVRGEHRIDIGENAYGAVIAGNHNLVIDARRGSTVTLLTPRTRPEPVRRGQVRLLPRRGREPLGRAVQLAQLAHAARTAGDAGGVVQLWGPPGVGKSTLLRHAARCLEPGPDGVVFLSAAHREVTDLAQEIFEACYEAPGYAPTETELRRLMAGVRVTVYIDDADLTAEQLRALVDAAPDATFVLAGRDRSLQGEGEVLELPGLDRAAGLELLARELGEPLPRDELDAAGELCALTLGRPLLLVRAAGLARFESPDGVRLPRPADVEGMLPLLFDRIGHEAGNALRLLATLDGAELDPVHIGALCDVPDPAAVCAELDGLGLALATERGYRIAPDAMEETRRRTGRPFPADRLCDHFTRWAALPTTTPDQIADHGRALEVAAELAERQGRPDLAVRLARAVSPLLARSLRFGVWGRLLDQGQNAARQADDTTARAYFTHEKAIRYLLIGRRVAAAVLLAEAVVLWRELGDADGVDAALNAQQYAPPSPSDAGTPPSPDGGTPSGIDPGSPSPSTADGGPVPGADPGGTAAPAAGGGPVPGADVPTAPPATDTGPVTGADGPSYAGDPGGASGTAAPQPPAPDVTAVPAPGPEAGFMPAPPGPVAPPPGVDGVVTAGNASAASAASAAAPASAASAAGAAGAAGGTAALTGVVKGVLSLFAVLAAVVVGGGVINELRESKADTSTGTSDAPANDLAGVWSTGSGPVVITASGDGSYTFDVVPPCAGSARTSTEVTGGDGSFSGMMPVWDQDSCTRVGEAAITIDVADDGSTAEFEMTAPADSLWQCFNCGTQNWSRLS